MGTKELVANKCIHWNGLMNDVCKAGIFYKNVAPKPMEEIPCLNKGGHCYKCQFPTEEEAQTIADFMDGLAVSTLMAYVKIKDKYSKDKLLKDQIDCECGGRITYIVASSNGHIWAKCNKCEIKFNE